MKASLLLATRNWWIWPAKSYFLFFIFPLGFKSVDLAYKQKRENFFFFLKKWVQDCYTLFSWYISTNLSKEIFFVFLRSFESTRRRTFVSLRTSIDTSACVISSSLTSLLQLHETTFRYDKQNIFQQQVEWFFIKRIWKLLKKTEKGTRKKDQKSVSKIHPPLGPQTIDKWRVSPTELFISVTTRRDGVSGDGWL